ncbi:N-methyl-L-tryptophan oxidase [Pseudalkalibacillus sp. A8]|uniref:N-methyl-L-tryptophan oxidase n=1 Tax=Pseudalkalibacillus sp. A8 TaxID=3382641 RepID=UPI0038B4D40D
MQYNVIIIGAGSMGMAAGYYLSKQGKSVLLIDENDPPHSKGSHHGESRIIRHAYGEGECYVTMALRAQELWYDLEKASGKQLFLQTGVLTVGEKKSDFIQNVLKSAEVHDLNVEKLTPTEINRKWKGFSIPEALIGCFEENSGVLFSEECIRAYRDLAIESGAILQANSRVNHISVEDGIVHVETTHGSFSSNSLIVAAGKGTPQILTFLNLELPLQLVRKTFSWFKSEESLYHTSRFPAYAFCLPNQLFYGFPSINGAGVKIGRHDGGQTIKVGESLGEFGDYPEDVGDVSEFAKTFMPEIIEHEIGRTCTYTNTPDGDFIIDQHPQHSNVVVAAGFSGHGFKFSSVVGEILSQLVIDGKSEFDLKPFSMERF